MLLQTKQKTKLAGEVARHRQCAEELRHLAREQTAREVRIQNLQQQLAQAVAACRYDARRESREIALRVAPLLLGDKEPRPFQLDARHARSLTGDTLSCSGRQAMGKAYAISFPRS